MDGKLFRLPTSPNFYQPLQEAPPVDIRSVPIDQQLPAPDSRFPGWPGPMSDARLVTDYLPHCNRNIPAGRQFPTKRFMQANAEELIRVDRIRAANSMGGNQPYDPSTVPPPVAVVSCTRSECTVAPVSPDGVGTERAPQAVPPLFGTFDFRAAASGAPPAANPHLTMRYEGGRNTPRGRTGPAAGQVQFDA